MLQLVLSLIFSSLAALAKCRVRKLDSQINPIRRWINKGLIAGEALVSLNGVE